MLDLVLPDVPCWISFSINLSLYHELVCISSTIIFYFQKLWVIFLCPHFTPISESISNNRHVLVLFSWGELWIWKIWTVQSRIFLPLLPLHQYHVTNHWYTISVGIKRATPLHTAAVTYYVLHNNIMRKMLLVMI